jgi:hypothetical protein
MRASPPVGRGSSIKHSQGSWPPAPRYADHRFVAWSNNEYGRFGGPFEFVPIRSEKRGYRKQAGDTPRLRAGTAGPATVLSEAMAVLWFIHADAMYGFPAYELPVSDVVRKLGGDGYFKFLCRLDQAPQRAREHNRDHVATYHRVLLELPAGEARSVRWRSGFYEVQDSSSTAVSKILGEPNIGTELGGAPTQ